MADMWNSNKTKQNKESKNLQYEKWHNIYHDKSNLKEQKNTNICTITKSCSKISFFLRNEYDNDNIIVFQQNMIYIKEESEKNTRQISVHKINVYQNSHGCEASSVTYICIFFKWTACFIVHRAQCCLHTYININYGMCWRQQQQPVAVAIKLVFQFFFLKDRQMSNAIVR